MRTRQGSSQLAASRRLARQLMAEHCPGGHGGRWHSSMAMVRTRPRRCLAPHAGPAHAIASRSSRSGAARAHLARAACHQRQLQRAPQQRQRALLKVPVREGHHPAARRAGAQRRAQRARQELVPHAVARPYATVGAAISPLLRRLLYATVVGSGRGKSLACTLAGPPGVRPGSSQSCGGTPAGADSTCPH